MRILILRHGDPDYENDTLTALGHRQAAALADGLAPCPITGVYASPYGRAQATAGYTAKKLGLAVHTLPWMREMNDVVIPSPLRADLAIWHAEHPRLDEAVALGEGWMEATLFEGTLLKARMDEMDAGARALLQPLGLHRQGSRYRVEKPLPKGDLAVFCHQGAGLTLAAFLLCIPPPVLWRSCYIAPASATTLLLEETGEGEASFRMLAMGETGHLEKAGVECRLSGLLYNTD